MLQKCFKIMKKLIIYSDRNEQLLQTLISESHDLRNYEMMMKQSKTSGYSIIFFYLFYFVIFPITKFIYKHRIHVLR